MSDLEQIFLVQINGELNFCYYHSPSFRCYDINRLTRISSVVRNSVLLEITPAMINQFRSQPYLIISENGFGLVESHRLQITKNEYIISVTLPHVEEMFLPTETDFRKRIFPKQKYKSKLLGYQLPNTYDGFENHLSPLCSARIDLVFSNDILYYQYRESFYTTFSNIRTYDLQKYTKITQIVPNTIYYRLESSEGYAIISISHDDIHSIEILYDSHGSLRCKEYNIRILTITRLIQTNFLAIIPDVEYNILPYKESYLVYDMLIHDILQITGSHPSIKYFIDVFAKTLKSMDKKYCYLGIQNRGQTILAETRDKCSVNPLDIHFDDFYPIIPILPEFIIINGDIIGFVSLVQVQKFLREQQIQKCSFDSRLQAYAGSSNRIITIHLKNGTNCLVRAFFDSTTKRIYNPED